MAEPPTSNTTESDQSTETKSDAVPTASLWPSLGTDSETPREAVDVKIYLVTGRHGAVRIPERFCRECNLYVRAADAAAEQVDRPVDVHVYSWWTRFLGALRYGGYHPPVMVVGGKKLCQGHEVPSTEEVVEAIEKEATR